MAVTSTIEYCTDRDMADVYPSISEFDLKKRLLGWNEVTTNKYACHNSGLVTQLFKNGEDLGPAQSAHTDLNVEGEWFYNSAEDVLYYFSATNPQNSLVESGDEWSEVKTRYRRKASRMVESMLDSRMSREIMKDREGNYPEFIIRATALKAITLLMKANDPTNEVIESFDEEFDEIIDGYRSGAIVLPTSTSATASMGLLREVGTISGSLRLVEVSGEYTGMGYDIFKVIVSTAGAVGTARFSVYAKTDDNLKSDLVVDSEIIDGDYQSIGSGMYVRWGGVNAVSSTASINDEYEIEVRGRLASKPISSVSSMRLTRT